MNTISQRTLRAVLCAIAFGALGASALSALAQKPPSAQEAERRKAMGGYFPERMKNPNLTGHPGKMTVTPPEEIPVDPGLDPVVLRIPFHDLAAESGSALSKNILLLGVLGELRRLDVDVRGPEQGADLAECPGLIGVVDHQVDALGAQIEVAAVDLDDLLHQLRAV